MPGDEVVTQPNFWTTRAVTIKAKPEEIWPWLIQMGYQRGGLYSYDWLDRVQGILDRPSANRILPELQNLKAGDEIPMGGGPSWPVSALEPNKSMILDIRQPGVHISWSFGLHPIEQKSTRLVLRIRENLAPKPQLNSISELSIVSPIFLSPILKSDPESSPRLSDDLQVSV